MTAKKTVAYVAMALIYLGTVYLSTFLTLAGVDVWIKFFLPPFTVLVGMAIGPITLLGVILTFVLVSVVVPMIILVHLAKNLESRDGQPIRCISCHCYDVFLDLKAHN